MSRRPTDHLIALLLAIHLFAITVAALPSAGSGLNRTAWKNPTVQEEFAAWRGRLSAVGIQVTPEQLEDGAFAFASSWNTLQTGILTPFEPYYDFATRQSWRMFVAPHRYPGRLHLDIDHGSGWEPLYVARSREHTWRRSQLDQDRFRSALFRYTWKHYQRAGRWDGFVGWVKREATKDFPDAVRVRARYYTYRTPSPDEIRTHTEPKGRFTATRIRRIRGTP